MGYEHSPKWFNISIFNLSLLVLVYYTILKKSIILIYFAFSLGPHIGEYRRGVNTIKNINYNKKIKLKNEKKRKRIGKRIGKKKEKRREIKDSETPRICVTKYPKRTVILCYEIKNRFYRYIT